MTLQEKPPILKPIEALARHHQALHLFAPDGETPLVLPGIIGTVFFERGSKPEVRAGILKCFDRFGELFGQHLKGGKAEDLAKFSKKNAAGVASIRRAITETPPDGELSVLWSSATNQDMAAEYQISTLTSGELPFDYKSPGSNYIAPKGTDGGALSYLKFKLPMHFITNDEGLAIYEGLLRFVCEALPVRGGYGGLSPNLPFSYHRYMPIEHELAKRFSGLEIDSRAFAQSDEYYMSSYEGESLSRGVTAAYPYLKPGAKVAGWGHIKSVNWYTLLGDVFVNRLGGEDKLRNDLQRSDIRIDRIGQCVLIRAGAFPRLGAPEEGLPEPYVFVNSVLRVLRSPSPDSLHLHIPDLDHAGLDETKRWEGRFDLPGAPPIPKTPEYVPHPAPPSAGDLLMANAGEICPKTGHWFAPHLSSRTEYVEQGQRMPGPEHSATGGVTWYLKL
jgi:hypothetical protein